MSKKDQFDPHGEGQERKDIADMSVDDLLNVLSGGKPSADTPAPYSAPAETDYQRSYDVYPPAEETASYESYAPEEDFSSYADYDPDEDLSAYADYDPDEDLSAYADYDPDEDITVYDPAEAAPAKEGYIPQPEAAEAPAEEKKPEPTRPKKLKKAEKKAVQEKKPEPEERKSVLRRILDEDPDELLNTRREDPENGTARSSGDLRRTLYTIAGLLFSVLACIGLVSVILFGGRFFGRYSSGDTGKRAMSKVIYPAVIMDIPAFSKPSDLSSNQIITAAIWSLVMDKDAVNKYERTFDVITVPAVDVESYAAKLFGSELPAFEHGNAGPSEARFYYSEENKSYNIPVRPVTFTYLPRIKSVSRSGNEYTLEVEYLEELPEWCDESIKKTVRYVLADTSEGYQIKSMQVLSQTDSMV